MSACICSQRSDLVGPPEQAMVSGTNPFRRIVSATSSVPQQMDSSSARCMCALAAARKADKLSQLCQKGAPGGRDVGPPFHKVGRVRPVVPATA